MLTHLIKLRSFQHSGLSLNLYQFAVKNGVLRICFKPGALFKRFKRFEKSLYDLKAELVLT